MSYQFDLVGENGLTRKTDENLEISVYDVDNLGVGAYTFYLTIRSTLPATTISDDTDTAVILTKTIVVNVVSPVTTITAIFNLTQTELNIDPKKYYYDIKMNYPDNSTISLTNGYALLEIKSDITRRNI